MCVIAVIIRGDEMDDIVDGFYTYDQIELAEKYSQNNEQLHTKIMEIQQEMKSYNIEFISAFSILGHCGEWYDIMINVFKLIPAPFGNTKNYTHTSSAPNLRESDACCICKHHHIPGYNEGVCKIHTRTYHAYNPELKIPLSVFCHEICDDYDRRE
jgi:hypothetical protein